MADALLEGLRQHFGFDDFQPGQRPVIESVMSGQPTVAIMPTGAGKSLCYQLPAVLLDGITLVVSPLIALMKDQVDALQARGIRAELLNSTRTLDETRSVMDATIAGELDLLYVAPERFGNAWFRDQIGRADVGLLAIDEAHCISRWGHDFRPDYRRLADAVTLLKPRNVLACTATATPEVQEDIGTSLQLTEPAVFVSGFLRDNLFIDVRFCANDRSKEQLLIDFLHHGPAAGGATIVYANTRKRVEALTQRLDAALDERVVGYHAGMSNEDRDAAQETFMRGEARVVVATNAFGMGVDRADVRAVVHAEMPRTVEGYYQEIGRAGRDREPSWCLLLYNANDSRVHEFLIEQSDSPEHRRLEHGKLKAMRRYIHGETCRHRALLSYFGDRTPPECPGCSRCERAPRYRPKADRPPTPEDTEIIRKALAGVARSKSRFGLKKVAGMLAGSRAKDITGSPLASLSTYGILGGLGVEGCAQLLQHLIDEGLCTIVGDGYPLLGLSPEGAEVMMGREEVPFGLPAHLKSGRVAGSVRARTSRPRAPATPPAEADERVLNALQAWRRDAADGKPAYTVFGNRTLFALAAAPPSTQEEFLATPGLGKSKWQRFGEDMLEVIEKAQRGEL